MEGGLFREYTVSILFYKGVCEELGVVACWPGVKELFGLASWLALFKERLGREAFFSAVRRRFLFLRIAAVLPVPVANPARICTRSGRPSSLAPWADNPLRPPYLKTEYFTKIHH